MGNPIYPALATVVDMKTFFGHPLWFFLLFSLWFQYGTNTQFTVNVPENYADSNSLVNIGVVLDVNSPVRAVDDMCMSMAISDFYGTHSNYRTRLSLHTMDSENVFGTASAAVDLLKNVEVHTIVGSELLVADTFLMELGEKTHVPFISFSPIGPTLSPTHNPQLIHTTRNYSSSVKPIVAILQEFEWREVVLIYEDTESYSAIIPYLAGVLQETGIRLGHVSAVSNSAEDFQISRQLNTLTTMQTRVFIVHMTASLASRLFVLAYNAGMMSEGYAWLVTDSLSNSLDAMDPAAVDLMEGVLGMRPHVPKSKDLRNFEKRWTENLHLMKQSSIATEQLNLFCLWAYDTISVLAMATEKIGPINTTFLKINNTDRSSIDLANLGISQIGPRLAGEILVTKIKGLSGEFHLVNGQLQPSVFEIFNMIGRGERVVGYWTRDKGISRNLESTKGSSLSTSRYKLKNIMWPGDSITVPKGWAIPKVRVGIPVKVGFNEFVQIQRNQHTNEIKCIGFSCDIFLAVLDTLDFQVPYEFVPFMNHKGVSAGTYNDLLYQIKAKKVDIVVGDTTIVANRSSYVDLTLPYSESGVTMIVPIKRDKRRNMWIFLQPWRWDLWLAFILACFCVGVVLRFMERHTADTELNRGRSIQQFGMVLCFAFSSLVLPQREVLVKYCSRFVLVVWLFLAFILMQSYTASLSSMLTIARLKPTFVSVDELRAKNYFVGYQNGSFVKDLLVNQLRFNVSKLKAYDTVEDYHKALSKGSENGGVAAIFDEIPYIRVFLTKYASKYMMTGPTYRTDGFGFAFPTNSRLVSYFSRAILCVRESKTMDDIEKRYFGHELTSQSKADPISTSSHSLSAYSFGGVFIITGASIFLALIISERYIWQKPIALAKEYFSSNSPNNTEAPAAQQTNDVIELSPRASEDENSLNLPSTANQVDENVSTEQAIREPEDNNSGNFPSTSNQIDENVSSRQEIREETNN